MSINYKVQVLGSGMNTTKEHGIFKVPTRCCIIGKPASGKSMLMGNFLMKDWVPYDRLILCVKSPEQSIYQYVIKQCEKYNVDVEVFTSPKDLPNIDEFDSEEPSLIVFDDMMNIKKEAPIITEFFTRGRNANISVFYLSQDFYQIPVSIRRSSDYFILFGKMNQKDLRLMSQDLSNGLSPDEFKHVYERATKEKYHFLMVDMNKGEFWHNLTQRIN